MSEHAQASRKSVTASKQTTTSRARQPARVVNQLGRDRIQSKSKASSDTYEQEADMVAKEVAGDLSSPVEVSHSRQPPRISLIPVGETVRSGSRQSCDTDVHADIVREVRQNCGGEPLPAGEKAFFEERFQHDFSDVRLHRGGRAEELCSRLQADAFTYGNTIYFRSSGYRPGETGSRQLLAHELTHVVQQGRAGKRVQRKASPGAEPAPGDNQAPVAEDSLPQADSRERADQVNQQELQAQAQQQTQQEAYGQQVQDQSLTQLDQADMEELPAAIPEDEIVVELPEQPAPEPEKIAEIEAVDFGGSSDQALLSYTDASPSSMAKSQPDLGRTLDGKIKDEAREEADKVPELIASASGQEDLAMVSPDPVTQAGKSDLKGSEGKGDNNKLEPGEHQNKGDAPDNRENQKLLDQQESGGFLGWFRKHFSSFMNRIRTTDSGLNTSAGERPKVGLDGDADPDRANKARSEAGGEIGKQRDETANALRTHPGQSNIKARAVEESKRPRVSQETAVDVTQEKDQGMADYAEMPLPEDVRLKSDELLAPQVAGSVIEARKQTEDAATTKETDKKKKIEHAEAEAQKLNTKADDDQKTIVMENRGKVAEQQRQGIKDANDAVADYNKASGDKQKTLSKDVREEVKKGEEKADDELRKGEEKADKKREEEEGKAARKKKELEKEQQNDSWWDRAVNAVKSAVKAITDAIDDIFNALRKAVADIIDAAKQLAVDAINAARDWVVEQIDDFRDWAKEQVDTYLKDTFPGLAEKINNGIDVVADTAIKGVNAVADTLIEGVEALADGLAAALDKILSVYQTALKAAVQIAGALLTGDFAEALRVAIQAACDIAGIDSTPIFDFIDRAKGAVMKILKDPVAFFMNIVNGVGGGVKNFAKNIKKHLINGLIGWLTGALSEVPITLPEKFDFKGILSLALQILGLTYDNIKGKVIKRFPPAGTVFSVIETSMEIVQRIITEGPIALWNMVKESISDLKETVLSGIRNFVIVTVVKEAVGWLLGLLNPAGAIVKVVKLLFDFTMFLIERFQQIKDFIMSVYEAITAIARGNLSKVMSAVEDALGRSLPVVISLLASLAGLGGIGKTVKNIIGKVSKPVNKVVDKLVNKIVDFAKKLLKKGKKIARKVLSWWKAKEPVKLADGKTHHIQFRGKGKNATLMMHSNPETMKGYLDELANSHPPAKIAPLRAKAAEIDRLKYDPVKGQNESMTVAKGKEIAQKMTELADMIEALQGPTAKTPKSQTKFKPKTVAPSGIKESVVGQYMLAEPLTLKAGGAEVEWTSKPSVKIAALSGSEPTQNTAFWTTVNERKKPERYIRGHLLNHHVFGPGRNDNLTPITNTFNGEMERKVESIVKQVILFRKKNGKKKSATYTQMPPVLSYEVNVLYAGQGKSPYIEAESYISTKWEFKVYYMKKKDGADGSAAGDWVKDTTNGKLYDDSLEHKIPNSADPGIVVPTVNLSTDSADKIATIPGIGMVVANGIIAVRDSLDGRRFSSYTQLSGVKSINHKLNPNCGLRNEAKGIVKKVDLLSKHKNIKLF